MFLSNCQCFKWCYVKKEYVHAFWISFDFWQYQIDVEGANIHVHVFIPVTDINISLTISMSEKTAKGIENNAAGRWKPAM